MTLHNRVNIRVWPEMLYLHVKARDMKKKTLSLVFVVCFSVLFWGRFKASFSCTVTVVGVFLCKCYSGSVTTCTRPGLIHSSHMVFGFIQHTSTTDAQVCVKNYNSDANNKDVITVDYMVTGGRQKDSIHILRLKNHLVSRVCTWRNHILKSETKESLKVLSSSGIRGTKCIPVHNFPAQ